MVILCILFIVIAILLIIGLCTDDVDYSFSSFCRTCGGVPSAVILMMLGIGLLVDLNKPSPKAIDVYRGKTELQIEQKVVNNKVVSTDSIVVWKK